MAPPNCLLAVLALTVFLGANNALPITSRPIEGNVQRMVWEDWVNLDPEQRNLTKEKKITAKSIFTLPFRHCPQGHTLFNHLCIPQSNIDPTDLIKQELILAGGSNGNPPPPPIGDYDYGDDEESEEIVYDLSVIPTAMQDGIPPSVGDGNQALPSEDAPLKFNIFEKKFPTGTGESEEVPLPPDMVAATYAKNISTTAETTNSTAPTSTATVATPAVPSGEPSKRTSGGDLMAASSDAFFTSTTITMPSSNSTTTNGDVVGQVEAIVLPTDQAHDGSLHLVTSSLTDNDSDDSSTTVNGFNAEADLAQLLKVDAFLPAYDGSIELLPPLFSHRKVAPPLSADQDVNTKQAVEAAEKVGAELKEEAEEEEVTATDIVPSEEEEYTTETATNARDTTVAEASMDTSPATSTSTSVKSSSHPPEEPEINERENRLVLIKSKVQPVQLTTTTSATATTAADAAASSSSTDRFHYQHFVEDVAGSSTTTATPEPEQSDMPASDNDNLMTNTIGGRGDEDDDGGHKATGEIDVQQELRLINELVKSKQRTHHQQQKQQLEPTSTEATSASASLSSTSTSTSTEDTTTTTTTTTATAYANWSKVMPQLGQSTSESAATTKTAATSSQVIESSSTASAAATEVKHLSITNRSNRNSKIIRVDRLAEDPEGTAASAATAATAESAATSATLPNSSSNPDGYTPFWWLPSIGWRLDRQLDGNGEDQSLLLRFFSTFRGSNTAVTTR
ncbi:protein folded gastrulation [Drosophila santomea]|uniref:protein folded gastrulation n=1 Tax=Drosophila santomea TaxID=129105 RepID=UPI001953483E|nr:protein folded gastrulation [Drosophila santomea]XP_039500784.1 protein folded gastrulation [Drosophila santomea]